MSEKPIISLQMPSDLLEQLKIDAESECITVSALIRKILLYYYKNKITES